MTIRPMSARHRVNGSANQWLRFRELGLVVFVVVVFAIATAIQPRFLSPENIRNILLYIPLITVVALGEMMVIITRNFDLSVGSILGFSAIVVGNIFIRDLFFPIWLAAIIAILIGALLGAVNGVLVAWLGSRPSWRP